MPRDFKKMAKNAKTCDDFIADIAKNSTIKKPLKEKGVVSDRFTRGLELFIVIRRAAREHVLIKMHYFRVQNKRKKFYLLEAYSYRRRKIVNVVPGMRRVLYAYDVRDNQIKNFVAMTIQGVEITKIPFRPRWPVEIGFRK